MRIIQAAVVALAVSGCASSATPTTVVQQNNPPAAAAAPATAPRIPQMTFSGDPVVASRTYGEMPDLWVETVYLKDRSVFVYSHLKIGAFPGEFTDADALRIDMAVPFYKDKGIEFDAGKVKSSAGFSYIVVSSSTHACFAAHANFGPGGKRGDQQVIANTCWFLTAKSPDQLEREMLESISRIKINGHPVPLG